MTSKKQILKEFRKFWLNKIKIHGSITSKDCEKFLSKAINKHRKETLEILKEVEVECAGSCGAGCEYAVRDLINKLKVK